MAYTVFPNNGKRPIAPYIISKITDSGGNILWEEPLAVSNRRVKSCPPCTSYRLHSIMRESLDKGSAQRVRPYLPPNFNGAVKSGSNYDFSDGALFGYTSSLTCGVWVGFLNDHHAIYPEAFGSDVCGPILGSVLAASGQRYKDEPIPMPEDTEEVEICLTSGQRATNFCFESVMKDGKPGYVRRTYREYFPKGDVSLGVCSVHGDGSPSLMDFMDSSNAGRMTSSRVLPVLPILPKSPALLGDDPYQCDVVLTPRYKDASDLADVGNVTDAAEVVNEDVAEEVNPGASESIINLTTPTPLRHLPLVPLQF